MPTQPDPLTFFRLKPIRAARVSEISETTSAAPVPPEQRINFHIGNPLQDERLSSAFLRIALGLDVRQEDLRDSAPAAILEALGWGKSDLPKLEFLIRTIQKSSPYLPRGGYSRKNPHALIKAFCAWLENQPEPLRYDTGESSGRREIILASGGVTEVLRILLSGLSAYLENLPARILCYCCELPAALRRIPDLLFEDLPADERAARGTGRAGAHPHAGSPGLPADRRPARGGDPPQAAPAQPRAPALLHRDQQRPQPSLPGARGPAGAARHPPAHAGSLCAAPARPFHGLHYR